ncbi:MAG: NAD-dependent protein deacylase [Clostridia bacterium]|nr:NAD-dependent protein deacylase [Clostridia bacterium]
MEKIKTLQKYIDESNSVVFFGGAGVSTESGIPDFRSVDGLYNMRYDYPPETILSHSFLYSNPKEFYRFYKDKLIYPDARPNAAHYKLAELERAGKLRAVVTQNIDGLHQAAGSKTVFELHGTLEKNYCVGCYKRYSQSELPLYEEYPRCTCGKMIRPDVVMYGEALDDDVVDGAINAIAGADLLIIAGTSMSVYPAAGLVQYFRGKHMVIVNRSKTAADEMCDLVICGSVGEVLGAIEVN